MDIKWETPAPPTRGRGSSREDELKVAAVLRDHPNEWARVDEFGDERRSYAVSLAQTIREGSRKSFRPVDGEGHYEASIRRSENDTTVLYVRFVTQS